MPPDLTPVPRDPARRFRHPLPPTDGHVTAVLIGGFGLACVGFGMYVNMQKGGVGTVRADALGIPGGLAVFWAWGLFTLIFQKGPTLTDGRVGVARRVFGRLWWLRSRPAGEVRRLVIRHAGGSTTELIAGFDGDSLRLVNHRPTAEVRRVAVELAAALGEVLVTGEDTRFTGTRTEQPVSSRVWGSGDEYVLGRVNVRTSRPVAGVRRFGPEFRADLSWHLAAGGSAAVALLYAVGTAGLVFWSAGELVFTGRTSGHVQIGPLDLSPADPPPTLGTRLALAVGGLLLQALFTVPAGLYGWYVGRRVFRDAVRSAAPRHATRTVHATYRNVALSFAFTPDALVLTHEKAATRWGWEDVAEARAHQTETGGESGGTVEWLELHHRGGEEWRVFGAPAADLEWLATRVRAAAGRVN